MSDNNKKTPLEEAKLNYEEIKKFAQEQAAAQLEEQVAQTLKSIFEEKLNEDITINISGENVDVEKEGETVASVADTNDNEIGAEEMGLSTPDSEEEFTVSDDEDEISVADMMDEITQKENMEEMTNLNMEQAAAAAPAPEVAAPAAQPAADAAAPAPDATAAPAGDESANMPELISKLDTLINIMLQQQGGVPEEDGATAGTEQDFDVIDDEADAAPAAAPAPAAATVQEFEIMEFDEEKNHIDEMEKEMIEIVDEDNMPEEGCSVEETRSLGFTSKRTGDKTLKMDTMEKNKGHHAPVTSLKENKAQYESKIDELIKENSSLKNKVKAYEAKEKEYEDAFVNLRTQFNEMQLFNGKLALFNKVLMNGGLNQEEKIKISEQFDSAKTYEEASKLFKNIIKEGTVKVTDAKEKLKSTSTNTAKPKSTIEPLYESEEARRAKKLAGIIKTEDEE